MKYPEFHQIIDTMTKAGYDYKKEIVDSADFDPDMIVERGYNMSIAIKISSSILAIKCKAKIV